MTISRGAIVEFEQERIEPRITAPRCRSHQIVIGGRWIGFGVVALQWFR
jgi:hypothetical protein